jgi:adenylate cyclase
LESFVEAEKLANKALALNDSLDMPHRLLAFIHLLKKEWDKAIYEAKHAVALNPNGADAIYNLGTISYMIGEPEKGIILLKKAIRLNPVPPLPYYHHLGAAYSNAGQYEKAIGILNQSISINPEALTPYLPLASCYIELNEIDKANKAAKKVIEIDPNFSLEYFKPYLIKQQFT